MVEVKPRVTPQPPPFTIIVYLSGDMLRTSCDTVEEAIKLYPEFVTRFPHNRVTLTNVAP